jgi:hypothetical protein
MHQAVNFFAKNGIGQHALDPVARDRLQDNPWVMRDFPQFGIKPAPHFVGSMIPRPAHIQGQLGKGIEPLDFSGQKIVDGMACAGSFAHSFSFSFGSAGIPECISWGFPHCARILKLPFPASEEGPFTSIDALAGFPAQGLIFMTLSSNAVHAFAPKSSSACRTAC